jgi:aryl-alcohol dehydrogenase-like predicted oxidoreductase
MDYTVLGRTGLRVSVAGLGCGGFSRLGLATGRSEAEAVDLVRRAADRGVNFFDTARSYQTEHIVGQALTGRPRDSVVIASKGYVHQGDDLLPASRIAEKLDLSLKDLRTDYIDVFQVHAPPMRVYDHVVEVALPLLLRAKEAGKIRHIGISEIASDLRHEVLMRAAERDEVEVMLIAFHMMHQSARRDLLPPARQRRIGTHVMYAVRNIFARPDALRTAFADLAAKGLAPADLAARENPLDFLLHEGGARTLPEAAYRFVRHQPGVDVVLFGTGNPAHVDANIDAILEPPLPAADIARVHDLFGHLEGVGLERPPWRVGQDGRPPEIPGAS